MPIMTDKRSQSDYRLYREFTDQHGRKFGAWADKGTNSPIGEFMPIGFNPPWLPPMRYATFAQTGDLHFRWNYAGLADELGGITAEYYKNATALAVQTNKPQPEVGGPVDHTLRDLVGNIPLSPALPIAAEAGEPWILGVPGAPVNPLLKEILEQYSGASGKEAIDIIRAKIFAAVGDAGVPELPGHAKPVPQTEKSIDDPSGITYKAFMAEARQRGMSMADISLAWQAHKTALAVERVA